MTGPDYVPGPEEVPAPAPEKVSEPEPGHPSPVVLERYVHGLIGAAGTPIELHLERCEACRQRTNAAVMTHDPARFAQNFAVVVGELDAPSPGVVERILVRAGIPADAVRLLLATPSLRRSWFIAIFVAMFFAMAAANPERPDSSMSWFLALAPLIPVIGVALAYGPGVDPSYEISLAAPISGFRLLMVRAAAVLATSLAIGGLVSLLMLPRHDVSVGAWLLPALALSLLCLALMSYLPSRLAAAVVGGGWLVLVVAVSSRSSDSLALFGPVGQLGSVVLALVAATVVGARRRSFDVATRELA